MKDDILIGDTPKAIKRRKKVARLSGSGRLWKHSRLSDIHGVVSNSDISNFFVVTIVRNPWDRMVSYYFWLQEQTFQHPFVEAANSGDFSSFLRDRRVLSSIQAESFGKYVSDQNGIERCDLFVRLENLTQDLAPFERHLGFRLDVSKKINASSRQSDYRVYYSDEDANLVRKLCAEDICRFNYSF